MKHDKWWVDHKPLHVKNFFYVLSKNNAHKFLISQMSDFPILTFLLEKQSISVSTSAIK